jgi:outer membrane protein OmpA-like peptidoglycan-associated protein
MTKPALFLTGLCGGVLNAQAPATEARIPFAPGVQLTWASSIAGEPDYESVITLLRGDSAETVLRISWNRGSDRRWQRVERRLSATERLRARSIYFYSSEENPGEFRGSTQSMASAAILRELREKGRAAAIVLVPEISAQPHRGALQRAGSESEAFTVLIDGRPATLPGVRARGRMEGEFTIEVDLLVLDDPSAPWILEARLHRPAEGDRGGRTLVRVGTGARATGLAAALDRACHVEVHDLFFAPGSAELDSTSAPALGAVADALQRHDAWRITIVGHTDSIGTAASNLDLSGRRAAAVRAALNRDYGVAADRMQTDRKGESQPLADNGTIAGRARNRRVDLVRACPSGERR